MVAESLRCLVVPKRNYLLVSKDITPHPPPNYSSFAQAAQRLGVGVLTVVAHQNLVRAEGVPGCGLGGLGSSHSAPMTGVANRASSPNTVTTHTKNKLHPHMATFEVVSGPLG